MAKRFTDTEKWKKVWFRKLKPNMKCFWQYVTDTCNHAGIWEVDFELAAHMIRTRFKEEEVREQFKKQYVEIDGGKRWFIKDFIEFQYGHLNPNIKAHKSAIDLLRQYGVDEELIKGFINPSGRVLDKDMDKDKDIEDKPHQSLSYLSNIPEPDLTEFITRFEASKTQVRNKAEDLRLYCESKGKKYKNYRSFLLNALKKDFTERPSSEQNIPRERPKLNTDGTPVIRNGAVVMEKA